MLSFLSFRRVLANACKLVPFLPRKPISARTAKEQNAPLLSRLPPELRQMIWKLYFDSHVVHFYLEKKKLRAIECLEWDIDDASLGPHSNTCGREDIQCNYILLLLTCKKIYFECVYILYRETAFDFSHGVGSLLAIPKRLPATHIALIRRVNFKWELYHPLWLEKKKLGKREIFWVKLWKALASMEGLEWLRVELKLASPREAPTWTELEWTWWETVKKVTYPSHFELILPFPAAASTREETLPCTVIRRVVDVRHPGLS